MVRRVIHFVHSWYERYERSISSISLVGGFILDTITLNRVDTPFENLWAIGLMIIAAVGIILINLNERRGSESESAKQAHFWLIIIIQFAFGGLMSAFLVFYFRSATLATSWPFILFLATIFILNEVLKKHYSRLVFQISVFYLLLFAFLIFFVPVHLHRIGDLIFLISGGLSLGFIALFIALLRYITKERFKKSRCWLVGCILGIYGMMNLFYFTNIIPPIPLSLKNAGVYHSLARNEAGNYDAAREPKTWKDFFDFYEDFNYVPGQPIYAYSAIFSPTDLNTTIVHRWQQYDEAKKIWVSKSVVTLSIVGGRGDGFRTYSTKYSTTPGKWRVDVETPTGKDIGRIKFEILGATTTPATEIVELK